MNGLGNSCLISVNAGARSNFLHYEIRIDSPGKGLVIIT
jgi:hypothetical protein